MTRLLTRFVAVLATFILAVPAAAQQAAIGTITGRVTDAGTDRPSAARRTSRAIRRKRRS